MNINLFLGDCIEEMNHIKEGSVDMILTDLPYQVLNKASEGGKWDCVIPLEPLWENFLRVAKENAAIVLFAQGMFTAQLMMSQPNLFRYNLIWDKMRASGFMNANRMPLRYHEDICVFYRSMPTYNPQMEDLNGREENHSQGRGEHKQTNRCYGFIERYDTSGIKGKKFPRSILSFPRPHCTGNHPTEKSVDLCAWLIRSYTNRGETVLDATMGSGTTGVACVVEDRNFIGIEKDANYFAVAEKRIRRRREAGVQEGFDFGE